ncbi:response regulator [Paenibacillus cymbidii]|uniref:response regulator n=1 Tax=Paenibacillus cymbidii TaxID=1639034 RepID=UPI001436973D|nr:response regulator [Paenibacillus cymbidii]
MRKYQLLFIGQFDETIASWRLTGGPVREADLYRLLHRIKGTAATIGLGDWSLAAERLLPGLAEYGDRLWPLAELERFVAPLLALRGSANAGDGEAAASLRELAAAGEETAAAVETQAAADPAKPHEALVLLVDDDVALLRVMKERLEQEGCMVMATPYPETALRWFRELKPDCVVLDVVMTGRGGFELLAYLQERSLMSMMPVLLMSAQNDSAIRIRAYESGADDFIPKPVEPAEFAARVLNKVRRKMSIGQLLRQGAANGSGPGGDSPQAGPGRVAVIDDDPLIRNMLERRVRDLEEAETGLDVRTYPDGEAFFQDEWHRSGQAYLLILDRMMPRMNGMEVVRRLRAEHPADKYRILMLTGIGDEADIAQAIRAGTDDYVTKPFRLPELEARIRRLLPGGRR